MLKLQSLSMLACCLLFQTTNNAHAQLPQPVQLPPPIAASQDAPYPGVIQIHVDATDVSRHIFNIRETVPVRSGETTTLLLPEWIPGKHGSYGRVDKIAGLIIHADGERISWVRDPINVYAFHVNVPPDVHSIDLQYQFLSPTAKDQGRIVMTQEMLNLQWVDLTLYPAGHFTRQIMIDASVTVPDGWTVATALNTAASDGGRTEFTTVSLEHLMDSPIFAGKYFDRVDLNPDGAYPVHLNIVADRADLLAIAPEQLEIHRALVSEADALFASHHFDHYEFLFALTDRLGGIGIEHHQSSENSAEPSYFTEWDKHVSSNGLLPHEYTHSWNGKFRIPAGLWAPDFITPMRGGLLWVYEGQTTYWGNVLGARAGFRTQQQALDALAYSAAYYDLRVGRRWRALQDTTRDPVASERRPRPWRSWERNEDYYSEGSLIWLDADTLIREASDGEKSLDDFAALFFGVNDGSYVPLTYTFDDVVTNLNSVHAYDWATFLEDRLTSNSPDAPLDGLERGGYKLVYTDTPTDYFVASEASGEKSDLTFSIGVVIAADGTISDVQWDGPAYQAGITVGSQFIAVNETQYDSDGLKRAISGAKASGEPVQVLIKDGDRYHTVSIAHFDGLKYPKLVRTDDGPAYLDQIFAPRR